MIKFLESSAKTGFNAQEMFIEAAKVLYVDYLKFNQNVFYSILILLIGFRARTKFSKIS